MQVLDILRQAQGGQAIANLARAFNLDPAAAEAVLASVLPELARGIERNTLSRGGLADIVKALGTGQHQRYLDDPRAIGHPTVRAEGNGILSHVLGEKDRSRGVAVRAARASGVDAGVIEQMLPFAAAMTMGALSRQTAGGFGDILARLPEIMAEMQRGGQRGGRGSEEGAGTQMPGGGGIDLPGGGFPFPQQQDQGQWPQQGGGGIGNQSPLPVPGNMPGGGSDGGFGRPQAPQQQPQGRNPLDDLSDILRKGGGAGGMGGGAIWNIVRSILGGALGFNGGGGLMSWLFRIVILRYGWGILRTILGKVLLGR